MPPTGAIFSATRVSSSVSSKLDTSRVETVTWKCKQVEISVAETRNSASLKLLFPGAVVQQVRQYIPILFSCLYVSTVKATFRSKFTRFLPVAILCFGLLLQLGLPVYLLACQELEVVELLWLGHQCAAHAWKIEQYIWLLFAVTRLPRPIQICTVFQLVNRALRVELDTSIPHKFLKPGMLRQMQKGRLACSLILYISLEWHRLPQIFLQEWQACPALPSKSTSNNVWFGLVTSKLWLNKSGGIAGDFKPRGSRLIMLWPSPSTLHLY